MATGSTQHLTPPSGDASSIGLPVLEAGDHLTAGEFLRRYQAMPEPCWAELIEGVVHMSPPVSAEGHGEPHFSLSGLLSLYVMQTSGVAGGDNSTCVFDGDNVPQPDAYLRIESACGGTSRLEEGYLHGPPELIAEVASTSASYDLHDKLNAYRRNGVAEYIVWRTKDRAIDWFTLVDGRYVPLKPTAEEFHVSTTFPGLWLDTRAIIERNFTQALAVLQRGLADPSHTAFVEELANRKTDSSM